MHRKDGARTRCNSALHLTYIDSAGIWFDVHEHRLSPDIGDSPGGRHKSHRDGDDLVPRSNITGDKRQVEGTRTGVNANAVAHATVTRKLSLKRRHSGAGGEGALIEHTLNRLVNLIADRHVLTLEIYERDGAVLSGHRLFLRLVNGPDRIAGHFPKDAFIIKPPSLRWTHQPPLVASGETG